MLSYCDSDLDQRHLDSNLNMPLEISYQKQNMASIGLCKLKLLSGNRIYFLATLTLALITDM